jgi:CelD/BcsL family acetyltransferase involved in cellulose biosynthesis
LSYTVRLEESARLDGEWRALLRRSCVRNVFVSPLWLRVWWEEFGHGRQLLLLTARQGQELVAVAPLMRDGQRLEFAGDTQLCDYMDVTVAQGAEEAAALAFLRSLDEVAVGGWQEVTIGAIPEYSPTLEAWPAVAQTLGLAASIGLEDVCPQVSLPSVWEEYLTGLKGKDRHELRRKLRRLAKGASLELEELTAPDAGALDDFFRLHAQSRAEKAHFMGEGMRRFFHRIVDGFAREGLVRLYFLRVNRVRAAAVLCFEGDDELLLYNSGYDPSFAALSVGVVSKALVLQRAIALGKRVFDFLRGAESYKYDLGARDLKVYRLVIRRP